MQNNAYPLVNSPCVKTYCKVRCVNVHCTVLFYLYRMWHLLSRCVTVHYLLYCLSVEDVAFTCKICKCTLCTVLYCTICGMYQHDVLQTVQGTVQLYRMWYALAHIHYCIVLFICTGCGIYQHDMLIRLTVLYL